MKTLRKRLEALEQTSVSSLEKIRNGTLPPKDRLRIVATGVAGSVDLRSSTCRRTLHDSGVLHEFVELKEEHGELAGSEGLSAEELNRWIATFPIELADSARNRGVQNSSR